MRLLIRRSYRCDASRLDSPDAAGRAAGEAAGRLTVPHNFGVTSQRDGADCSFPSAVNVQQDAVRNTGTTN